MNLTDPLCLANIKACCAASQLAYAQTTITDATSGESVLIQNLGDSTVIAFPGTHDLRDVLRDLDCLRVSTTILGQPCSVHAGFNRAYNALIAKIIERLQPANASTNAGLLPPSPWGEGRGEGNRGNRQPMLSIETKDCRPHDSSPSPPLGERVGVRGRDELVAGEQQPAIANLPRDPTPSPLNGDHNARSASQTSGNQSVAGLGSHWAGVRGENAHDAPDPPALFLTGHSKGAAVARRCALALLENNLPVTGLITFGEPRGGDARYAKICDAQLGACSLRITNAADPVPWLPGWLAGNRHCGTEGWMQPCSGVSMSADGGHRLGAKTSRTV